MKEKLISTFWLKENLNNKDLIVLDASPKSTHAGLVSEFPDKIIPSARHFDLQKHFRDKLGEFPNTLPSGEQFETECRKLGINNSSQIIVYDNLGIYTSPRVWWMFKTMGHDSVAVLDGGLPEWIRQRHETTSKNSKCYKEGNFNAKFKSSNVTYYDYLVNTLSHTDHLIVDARSKGRYKGNEKDPRANLQSGHIPNSINITYQSVLDNGKYKSEQHLRKLFEKVLSENQKLIFSCGSGITACIVLLASELILPNNKSVYDGSWTEWATKQNLTL